MSEDESDDDWFEQALGEERDANERPSTQPDEDPPTAEEPADWFDEDHPDGPDDDVPDNDVSDDPGEFEASTDQLTADSSPEALEGDSSPEDSDGSLFEEDFGSALQSAGEPGGGDSAGEPAPSESEFEDDGSFESEIPRIDLGIEGLDGMIQGGIPQRHLMVVIGSPGTGKTTFGLQFLHHGLEQGENAVFITLEQSRESILDTADERGWAFDRYEREDRLAIVDLDPVEMANSLENIRGEFPQLVREFGADRLVLDSVSLLEMMYDDQARRRTEVFDFTRSLKDAGVTTMFTSEANEGNPYASRHGIIEYLTDAVFVLQYVRGDTQETRLAVEIQKIRNANHSRATKPYAITLEGIDVYQQASIF